MFYGILGDTPDKLPISCFLTLKPLLLMREVVCRFEDPLQGHVGWQEQQI